MTPSLLVLTDFFQAADRVLAYASGLAGPLGARLVLLHVRRDALLDPNLFTGELSNLNQEAASLALNRVAGNIAVPVVAEVGHGRVATAVAEAAGRHQPLLLVLGRSARAGTPDELLHSTALDILRTSPRPLLVVPSPVVVATPPRRVLLAVDGDDFSLGTYAGAARRVLEALRAELTVLYAAPEPGPSDAGRALETVARTGLSAGLAAPVQARSVAAAQPADGILRVAEPADYDLVALIARPRSFLGTLFHRSVTAQVLLHSTVPVLVLPATA